MTAVDTQTRVAPGALDPLRAAAAGRYEDSFVIVERGDRPWAVRRLPDGRVFVGHRLTEVDDDLAELLAAELAPLTDEHEVFARAFTGIVLTSDADPLVAWERFYRNSVARILHVDHEGYAGIYRHALDLLPRTSVLDLGCGFGFLSLRLAELGVDVTACDSDPGTVRLLRQISNRLDQPLDVVQTDGGRVPLPDSSVDAVAILHVLEHVSPDEGRALVHEGMRVARNLLVIAVPYESRATRLYGHVRRFRSSDLRECGSRASESGWRFDVHDHLGGWLVLSRPSLGRSRPPARTTESPGGVLQ